MTAYSPKYTTLDGFKSYLRTNPDVPGAGAGTDDDTVLLAAIARAEESIDCFCGSEFQYATASVERALDAWVDRYGWLQVHLFRPIAAVTTVEVLNRAAGDTDFKAITLTQCFTEPLSATGVKMNNFRFACLPAASIDPCATGSLYVRATYNGGFQTIPAALTGMTNRLAHFDYMQREAPISQTATSELGTMEIPLDVPPDIRSQLQGWRNLPA